uniref:Uncharacterized protein LOC105056509 n=1 Tax=Elaeis guineensis var. tenera TaxID=51953 RepID=A0A6I9S3J7_ELAGV|nr:uncharacterized protein LOC105056509 [Elaeis guineensis]
MPQPKKEPMGLGAMAGEESSGSWSSSTNWIAAEGSLRDSISFETFDEEAPALTSSGVLLVQPPSDDPPPCEVTISFREKHEIHGIYVRSTAQMCEIYHAADQQNKRKEYLCRVSSDAAAREFMPPITSERAITESQNGNDETLEKHEKLATGESNNSVEDGWVEVKVPDSPQQNDQANALSKKVNGNSSAKFQIHYGARAIIFSDTPCLSLTLRLLSLQTKTCIHVEEICVYANHVDSPNPNPPVCTEGNLDENPLPAMLVPSFLQLSKLGTSRIQDKYFSVDTGVQKHQQCFDKAAGQSSLDMHGTGLQEAICSMKEQNLEPFQEETMVKSENIQLESGQKMTDQADRDLGPVQEQTEVKPEDVQLGSSQKVIDQADQEMGSVQNQTELEPENVRLRSGLKVTDQADQDVGPVQKQSEVRAENIQFGSSQKITDMDQVPKCVVEENNPAYGRVEKVLDELVSRMGRIEAFCSRFEENMMKPLSCIQMRLQRIEQQVDVFAGGIQSSERNSRSRISAPEFSFDESDSDNKDCNTSFTKGMDTVSTDSSFPANDVAASLSESKMFPGLAIKAPKFHNEDDFSSSASDGATSVPESNMHPGLVVEAPEFLNEEEECTNTEDTLDSSVRDHPKDKTSLCIDGALASALAAFLTSTTVKSPKPSPDVMEEPHGFSVGNKNGPDSTPVGISSEGSDKLSNKIGLEKNGGGTSDVVKETNCGCSLSSADVVLAPDTSLNESDLKGKGCDTSDAARGVAAFDYSSLLGDNTGSSVSVPHNSVLIVTAPEFPIEEDNFIDYGNASDSDVENFLKDQESVSTAGKSTSALGRFLSLRNIKSSHNSTSLGATLDLFNGDNYELASSSFEVPCEGIERVGVENHGKDMVHKVDLDQIFNLLPPDHGLEQREPVKLRHQNGCTGPTIEGSTTHRVALEGGVEQKDHGLKWYGSNSTESTAADEGYFMQKVFGCMHFQSNGGIHNNWQDGSCLDASDAEEAGHASHSLNQFGRGWTEDCSSDSSFDENLIKSKVQIDWSDDSSTDSIGRSFTVNQHCGQVADNYRSSQAFVDDFSEGVGLKSVDFKYEKSLAELIWPFDLTLDCEDNAVDVRFVPAGGWGTGLALEALLGGTCNVEVQVSTVKNADDGKFVAANLVEMEDPSVRSETCLWDAELQGEISNQLPISSLI